MDQLFLGAVGEPRGDGHFASDEMHVRHDRLERHVGRDRQPAFGLVVRLARGDAQLCRADREGADAFFDRRFREIKSDLRRVGLRLAGAVVVDLHDHVRAFRQPHADARRQMPREIPRRPATERAIRQKARPAEGDVSGVRRGGVQIAGASAGIEKKEDVMHDRGIAWAHLHGGDVAIRGEGRGQHESLVNVAPLRPNLVALRRLEDEVRLAKHPAHRKLRHRRQILHLALRRARFHPLVKKRNLLRLQRPRVVKSFRAFVRAPGRHQPVVDRRGDGLRFLFHLRKSRQRKRADLARAMAHRAVPEDERRDVFRESYRLFRGGGTQGHGRKGRQAEDGKTLHGFRVWWR